MTAKEHAKLINDSRTPAERYVAVQAAVKDGVLSENGAKRLMEVVEAKSGGSGGRFSEAVLDMLVFWARTGAAPLKTLTLPRGAYFTCAYEFDARDPHASMRVVYGGPLGHEIITAQVPENGFRIAGPQGWVDILPEDE